MRLIILFTVLFTVSSNIFSNEIIKKIPEKALTVSILPDQSFEDVKINSVPGEPKLPYLRYEFLLPNNADLKTIDAQIVNSEYSNLKGIYDIKPAEGDISDGVEILGIKESRECEIYNQNSFFPANNIYSVRSGYLRQYKIVNIAVFPYQYNPVSRTVKKLNKGSIKISYSVTEKGRATSYSTPVSYLKKLKASLSNYSEMIQTYNLNIKRAGENYTIITTKSIEANLNKLNAFINNKKARGFDVDVITEDVWGGGSGNSSADNLRAWLENNYLQNGITYLLIIGDPSPSNGDIAMKNAYAYYGGKIAHTDFYFSELTGNWDADGDGRYGELDDVKASGGIDAYADISVGRIPCYNSNYSAVDKILQKSIDYECARDNEVAWRKNMLLAMDGYYGSEGPEVGEKIKDDIEVASSSWDFYRIYCNHMKSPEEGILTPQAVTNAWSSNAYGVVSWLTHGSETAAMNIFSTSYVSELNDEYPSFVVMGSCLNGKPNNSGNLAYSVLKNGGIGVIAGSETTIFKQPMGDFVGSSYNHGMIHAITKNISLDGSNVIDAFDKARHDADMGCWKNYCAFNLYGDPCLGIEVYGVEGQTGVNHFCENQKTNVNFKINGNILKIDQYRNSSMLKIFSSNGKVLMERNLMSESEVVNLNEFKVSNSIIFCQITNNSGKIIKKLKVLR